MPRCRFTRGTVVEGPYAEVKPCETHVERIGAGGHEIRSGLLEKGIFVVRERQVMLDEDLADPYGVETRVTKAEAGALRSQFVTSDEGRSGRRYAPYVFTEQGVAMLSGVLRSDRAIAVNR
jgi:hypothetical protein